MSIIRILLGFVLLIFGRRLFWLFAGGIGFLAGMYVARQMFPGQPAGIILAVALGIGLSGVLVAFFLQKLAVTLAGFISGGYILLSIINVSGWETGRFFWILFFIAGISGAVLVTVLFDWALIAITAFVGAMLIISPVCLFSAPFINILLFNILFAAGIILQVKQTEKKHHPESRRFQQ